ncbi:MAG: YcxB family protein [Planctomycetota bacterium]
MADNPYASPAGPPKITDPGSPLQPPQSVTVTLNEPDYLAFVRNLHHSDVTIKQLLRRQRTRWFVLAGILLLVSFYFGPDGVGLPTLERLTRSSCIGFAVLGVIAPWISRWKARRQIRRTIRLGLYGDIDTPITVTLEESGVRNSNSEGDGLRYWHAVRRVEKTDDHLFIYLQQMTAAILPLRAFQSEQQFHQFAGLAERLRRAAYLPSERSTGG